MVDRIPEKLGKYAIHAVAGKGAQGIVLRGHDPFVDRAVAIKLCRMEDSTEEARLNMRKFFFNEAQAAGQLDHPNILRVYDAGEFGTEPYIVMEYVAGSDTLRSYVREANLLPPERAVGYVRQCAEALDYAHRRGVTHRDVKPANIMVTTDDNVKLVDFGIAFRAQTDKTQLAGNFGSPRYMSPEQARGDEVGTQSDLFSLGVVLYELLTGTTPFEAQNVVGMVYQIVNKEPRPIREHLPDLPEAVVKVIDRALEKDIARRYKTGAEMADDLGVAQRALEEPEAHLSEDQKLAMLGRLSFFSDFGEAELEEALDEGSWDSYPVGAPVVQDGDQDRALFVVVSGQLRVMKGGVCVNELTPGDCFGELGFLEGVPRIGTVVPTVRSTLLRINAPTRDWASIPCQQRFAAQLQRTIIDQVLNLTARLAEMHN